MKLSDAEDHLEQSLRSGGQGPVTEKDVAAAAAHDAAQRATGAVVPARALPPRTYLIMCGSVRRALDLMAELDSVRTPADLERVQHGVSHELESLAKALKMPATRGRHASVTITDDVPEKSEPELLFELVKPTVPLRRDGGPELRAVPRNPGGGACPGGRRRFGCTC